MWCRQITRSFRIVKQADRFYGRGVYDMKFAAACYLELMTTQAGVEDICFALPAMKKPAVNGFRLNLSSWAMADVMVLPDGGENWCRWKSPLRAAGQWN